jgi:hypothetical protein
VPKATPPAPSPTVTTDVAAEIAAAEALLLQYIESPQVKAVGLTLVKRLATKVESKTENPVLKQGEVWAFALVEGYLAPAAPAT